MNVPILSGALLALAVTPASVSEAAPVITRIAIGLVSAQKMLAAAEAEARRNGAEVSIVVVDDRGAIIAAQRMDGTGISSFDIAIAKARTAAATQAATADLNAAFKGGAVELNTLAGQLPFPGGMALIGGGVPVHYGSAVVGAVGVSGADPTLDAKIAAAGARVLAGKE